MSDQEQLPVCALCGEHPKYNGRMVGCSRPSCDVRGALMEPEAWRRLMARPRLAPDHEEWLRQIAECSEYGMRAYEELIADADPATDIAYIREQVASYKKDVDAIRAAIAALGEV